MRRLVIALLALGACGGGQYNNNDLVLAPAYRAKEVCSCVFVMGMPEDFCKAWTVATPNVAAFSVDRGSQTVTSNAILLWGARASVDSDARFGCTEN